MRRVAEMLLLLFACAGFTFLLDWFATSGSALLSGTVVDWTTGQAVPHVMVRYRLMNGAALAGYTDGAGHFSAQVPRANIYPLFVEDEHFGSLLGTTFGRTVLVFPRGRQHHTGIVVPAIPGTEISGHVYDEKGKPLPGCEVSASIKRSDDDPLIIVFPFQRTDKEGAFSFTRLGADRYLVAARCRQYLKGEFAGYQGVGSVPWSIRNSWPPAVSKTMVLLPGTRRTDVDFHLRAVPHYSIFGNVLFADGSKPQPGVTYFHELNGVRVDGPLALASQALLGEACDWDAGHGTFHCDFLAAGQYRLTFHMGDALFSQVPLPEPQGAEVTVDVQAGKSVQPALNVRLQVGKPEQSQQSTEALPGQNGYLQLHHACGARDRDPWTVTLAWNSQGQIVQNFIELICSSDSTWPLASGEYMIASFNSDLIQLRHVRSDRQIYSLIRSHGTPVTIRPARTSQVTPPFFATDAIIRVALDYLRSLADAQ